MSDDNDTTGGDTVAGLLTAASHLTNSRGQIDTALYAMDGEGNWQESLAVAYELAGDAIAGLEQARGLLDLAAGGKLGDSVVVEVKSIGEAVSFLGAMMQGGRIAGEAMLSMQAKRDQDDGQGPPLVALDVVVGDDQGDGDGGEG